MKGQVGLFKQPKKGQPYRFLACCLFFFFFFLSLSLSLSHTHTQASDLYSSAYIMLFLVEGLVGNDSANKVGVRASPQFSCRRIIHPLKSNKSRYSVAPLFFTDPLYSGRSCLPHRGDGNDGPVDCNHVDLPAAHVRRRTGRVSGSLNIRILLS